MQHLFLCINDEIHNELKQPVILFYENVGFQECSRYVLTKFLLTKCKNMSWPFAFQNKGASADFQFMHGWENWYLWP